MGLKLDIFCFKFIKKKGFRKTLETFDEENPKNETSAGISSRTKLIDYLGIQKLYEKNKVFKSVYLEFCMAVLNL